MVVGGMHGCGGACVVAGVCVWLPGGMHGCWGVCMVAGGHAWLWGGVVAGGRACMVGGCAWLWGSMCGCWGACMVAGGHTWFQRGACMVVGGVHGCGGHAWFWGDKVNERAVRILMECILVEIVIFEDLEFPEGFSSPQVPSSYTNLSGIEFAVDFI